MTRREIHDNPDTPLTVILSPSSHTNHTTVMMGVSWQTPDQKVFIEEHLPAYFQHLPDGTVKSAFWPDFFNKWFKAWPLPEPSPTSSRRR